MLDDLRALAFEKSRPPGLKAWRLAQSGCASPPHSRFAPPHSTLYAIRTVGMRWIARADSARQVRSESGNIHRKSSVLSSTISLPHHSSARLLRAAASIMTQARPRPRGPSVSHMRDERIGMMHCARLHHREAEPWRQDRRSAGCGGCPWRTTPGSACARCERIWPAGCGVEGARPGPYVSCAMQVQR